MFWAMVRAAVTSGRRPERAQLACRIERCGALRSIAGRPRDFEALPAGTHGDGPRADRLSSPARDSSVHAVDAAAPGRL
jgi:hypothetical protein